MGIGVIKGTGLGLDDCLGVETGQHKDKGEEDENVD